MPKISIYPTTALHLYVPQDLAAAESLYERASADESGNAILLIEVSEKSSMKFKMIDSLPRQVVTSAAVQRN